MPAHAERLSLAGENEQLRARLEELEETLRGIRSGEVDALVVETAGEARVFTLKTADQTYRLMVEEMQKGAATLSAEGVVLYCNPFLAELLDVPLDKVLGTPLSGFLDGEPPVSLSSLLRDAASGVSRGEVSFRRRRGSVSTHVSLTLLPLEGPPVFSMIVTDLTDSQLREKERAQLEQARLGRMVAEDANKAARGEIERRKGVEASLLQAEVQRTELLERERIARTEAEEANRMKDEFLATLSHELRSPLNAIVAWSHILREPGLDPVTSARAVEAINRNSRAQAQIVGDLLDVSRIVTGKFQLRLGPVRLSAVIDPAVDAVRPAAGARGIQLELPVDPAGGLLLGDAGRLQQVIWNLLSNAVKWAPEGGRVQVRVEETRSCIELSVTDDGPGIDPAFLPHVFERFRQADSSSTRCHAGLGLGLAIVRHLVELHGGTVEARNREDRTGAVLTVRLPRQHGALTESSVAEQGRSDQTVPSLQGISVLVVDDEEDASEAMAIGLGLYGARVVTASSARQALDTLVRERPEVLVADIGMAGEDGYSLLQRVRALPAESGGATPAIALTGYASEQSRVDAVWAGFQVHLSKPITPAELATEVAALVAPARPGPGSR